MAGKRTSLTNLAGMPKFAKPKTTRQGKSKNTNLASSSANSRKKRYQGQGK